jgi:hypothetical protein
VNESWLLTAVSCAPKGSVKAKDLFVCKGYRDTEGNAGNKQEREEKQRANKK